MSQISWGQRETASYPADVWIKEQKRLYKGLRQCRKLQRNENEAGIQVQEMDIQSFRELKK